MGHKLQHHKNGSSEENASKDDHEKALEAALRKSEEKQNSRWQKVKNHWSKWESLMELAALLVIIVYTFVTSETWIAQLESNGISNSTYIASSRPWVMLQGHSILITSGSAVCQDAVEVHGVAP
ncbi:MAG: hypothetical protein NVSMB42_25030 [Herpetosiphon sp.]